MTETKTFLGWLRCRRVELISLAVAALLVVIDQITKLAIVAGFAVGESKVIIEGVLHFTYVRNPGAVFGSFSGQPYIFNTVTTVTVLAGIALLLAGKIKSTWLKCTAALIISGGIGNMIDRIRLQYVVDFIDVKCFGSLWTWVFNIADCCVVIGCLMFVAHTVWEIINDTKQEDNSNAEN